MLGVQYKRSTLSFDRDDALNYIFAQMLESFLSKKFQLLAPAKINLRLKVEGRRSDGYHLLSMINAPVDLCDTIEVRLTDQSGLDLKVSGHVDSLAKAEIGDYRTNLASKAFLRFCETFSLKLGAEMLVHKRIPSGAGMGGGSSDAGSVLRWLSAIFVEELIKTRALSEAEFRLKLLEIALELGADVPFFLHPEIAWVRGIGGDISPIEAQALVDWPIAIIQPPFRIATPEAFSAYRLRCPDIDNSQDVAPIDFIKWLGSKAIKDRKHPEFKEELGTRLSSLICNDLEGVVRTLFPDLDNLFVGLCSKWDCHVSLTGSGSVIFMWSNDLKFWNKHSINLLRIQMAEYGASVEVVKVLGLGSPYRILSG